MYSAIRSLQILLAAHARNCRWPVRHPLISIGIDVPTIGGGCSSREYYIRMERYLACIARAMAHWLSIVDLAGLRCATCAITNACMLRPPTTTEIEPSSVRLKTGPFEINY